MSHAHIQDDPATDQLQAVADSAARSALELEPERPTTKHIVAVISVLVVSALIMILNETVPTVALPNLMADFSITAATAQWLTTGFMLTMAVVIPTTGWMLQRFTTKGLFTAALLLFVIGTAMAAFAPTFAVVLLGRIVQAGGTAIILPLLMTTTLTYVPPAHRGTIMGLNSVVISVAPAIGPTISGVIVNALNWHWVFGLMLPVGVVVLVLGLVLIRTTGETRRVPLDFFSVLLSVVAFGGIVYGLGSISALFQGSWVPVLALAIGAVALVLFTVRQVRLQRTTDAALLDLRPFGVHNFRVSVIIVMIAMATMLGTVMVLPIFLQTGMGINVLTVGLIMLPGGLIQGVLSPVIGRVYDKVGPRPVVIPGAILLAGGQWLLATVNENSTVATIIVLHVIFCIGMAMLMTPLMTVALGALPQKLYGHGSAIMNTLQQLSGAAGTAVLVAAMTLGAVAASSGGASEALAQVAGAQTAFVVGGVLGLVAVVCAPFVKKLPPVPTRVTVD